MEHAVWWDEDNGCVRIRVVGELLPEHAETNMEQAAVLLTSRAPRLLVIDYSQSPGVVSSATREVLERRGEAIDYDRLAFYGMGNFNRIVARIIIALLGRAHKTGFFATEAEALTWLREN